MSLPHDGIHRFNPRPGELWAAKLINREYGEDQFRINGQVQDNEISGLLTIFHEDGDFDGYDWDGPEINPDVFQEILDAWDPSYDSGWKESKLDPGFFHHRDDVETGDEWKYFESIKAIASLTEEPE